MVVRILIVLGLLMATLAPALAPDDSEAKKKKRHKTVTRQFPAEWPPANFIPIPDQGKAGIYPLEFLVKGLRKGKLRDVNLIISFCHEFADDLDMLLVAPNGTWRLYIHDDFADSPGYLYPGARLEITARVKRKT